MYIYIVVWLLFVFVFGFVFFLFFGVLFSFEYPFAVVCFEGFGCCFSLLHFAREFFSRNRGSIRLLLGAVIEQRPLSRKRGVCYPRYLFTLREPLVALRFAR